MGCSGKVNNLRYSTIQCYVEAVEGAMQTTSFLRGAGSVRWEEAGDCIAWSRLGQVGGGSVNGVQYSTAQCIVKALEADSKLSNAWQNLGDIGGGEVSGYKYTKNQCRHQAVRWKRRTIERYSLNDYIHPDASDDKGYMNFTCQ